MMDLMQQRQRLLQGGLLGMPQVNPSLPGAGHPYFSQMQGIHQGGLLGMPQVNPSLPGAGHPYFSQMQGIHQGGIPSRGPFERFGNYQPPAAPHKPGGMSMDQLEQQLLQLGLLKQATNQNKYIPGFQTFDDPLQGGA